jgi:hypothetical protein
LETGAKIGDELYADGPTDTTFTGANVDTTFTTKVFAGHTH